MHLAIASFFGSFLLDESPKVIIDEFFVSLEKLEVFYGVRVESPEALEILPEPRF